MSKLAIILQTENLVVYSPVLDGEVYTEFEKFIIESAALKDPPLQEDRDIIRARIKKMAESCGAQENLFRPEGSRRDNVLALPTLQTRRPRDIGVLRLYCDRISDMVLIIGNGGVKKVQKYQEDTALHAHVKLLHKIDRIIQKQLIDRDIDPDNKGAVMEILNNLVF